MDAHTLGWLGERYAAMLYRLRGYAIVGRNVRIRGGEIDLIAARGGVLAFVEVKTRRSNVAGEGFDAVTPAKQLQLFALAEAWLATHRDALRDGGEIRFDVVSLFWTGRRFVTRLFADAFRTVSDPRRPWRWRM